MFNKIKIHHLLIAFAVLAVFVAISFIFEKSETSNSFKSELSAFDTAQVTRINVYPKAGGEMLWFIKEGQNWLVENSSGKYNADNRNVENLIQTLEGMKAMRLAATSEEKWAEDEVNDSLGIHVEVVGGNKMLADLYIGKFSYTASPDESPYMQQQQGIMTSYVRLNGEKEVYVVEGFLSMMFNREIDAYRDANIVQLEKNKINRVVFMNEGEQFVLAKKDSLWLMDGLKADSLQVENFLDDVIKLRSTGFLTKQSISGSPIHTITFEGETGLLAKVDLYSKDSTRIPLVSSQNKGTIFDASVRDIAKKLVKTKEEFISPGPS